MEQLETYQPLSWAHMVHGLPHLNLHLQAVGSAFLPRDWEYQQTLIVLAGLTMLTFAINLTFLLIYLLRLCCCSLGEGGESQTRDARRLSLQSLAAVVLCCSGIGVGFYGNNDVNEGIYQAAYSLRKVNHTLVTMETLIQNTTDTLSWAVTSDLTRLEEIFGDSAHFLVLTRNCRRQTEALLSHLGRLAFWRGLKPQLLELEQWARHTEGYRNLLFLLLLILDLVICLLVLLGLARKGSWLLIGVTVLSVVGLVAGWLLLGVESVSVQALSDFCVDPRSFVLNITLTELGISEDLLDYYLTCDDVDYNPFHEPLILCQRTMSALDSQMHSLQREAIAEFPAAQIHLEATQRTFARTERVVSHLTVLLNCWRMHTLYEDVLRGVCYKGLGGSLYLCLFSVLTVMAFCFLVYTLPQVQLYTQSRRTPGHCDLEEDDGEEVGHFASQAPRRPHQARDRVPALCPYPRNRSRPPGVRASAPPISLAQLPHYT